MQPPILSLRLLETCHDGAVPHADAALADAGGYDRYVRLLAQAAERRFHRRILGTLHIMASWRAKPSPWRWHRLEMHSKSLHLYRQRACEAFDLCQ